MTDKLQFEKDQKSRIEAMREERVRMQLKSKEKKLRNQYEKLSSDKIIYKFDTDELTLSAVDHKSGKFLTYLELPKDLTNSQNFVREKFAKMYESIKTYEKNSLDKIFREFMEKFYMESIEKLKEKQKIINKQKQLEILRIENLQQNEIISNQKKVKKLEEEKQTKLRIEKLRQKNLELKEIEDKKKQIKRKIQKQFLDGFYMFVNDSQMKIGVTDTRAVIKSDEFHSKMHLWMAKYKLKLKDDELKSEGNDSEEKVTSKNKKAEEQQEKPTPEEPENLTKEENSEKQVQEEETESPENQVHEEESEKPVHEKEPVFDEKTLLKENIEKQKTIRNQYEKLTYRNRQMFTNIYEDQKVISAESEGKQLEFTGNDTCSQTTDPSSSVFDIIQDDAENLALRMYTTFTCSADIPSQKTILKIFYDRTVKLLLDDVDQTQIAEGMIGVVNFSKHHNEIKLMLIHEQAFQKKMIFYLKFENEIYDKNVSDKIFYSEKGKAILGVIPKSKDVFFGKRNNGSFYGVLVKSDRKPNGLIAGGTITDDSLNENLEFYFDNKLSVDFNPPPEEPKDDYEETSSEDNFDEINERKVNQKPNLSRKSLKKARPEEILDILENNEPGHIRK